MQFLGGYVLGVLSMVLIIGILWHRCITPDEDISRE